MSRSPASRPVARPVAQTLPSVFTAQRLFAAVIIAAAAATAFAPQARAADKVAMLLPGSINDQSWNAAGFGAVGKLKAAGDDVAFSENVAPADRIEAMKDYARRGYTSIIGHSGSFLSAAQRVGPEFEKVTFIIGSGGAGAGKNVVSVDYDNAQMGYMMGVLAARLSKSNKVGSVNGLEGLPNVVQQVGGFRQGVKSVKPTAEVKVIYIKDMEDAAMAKEAALALISGGADFVFGKLNAGQNGIVQAAKEKKVYTSGRSFAHAEMAPDQVVTTIVEKWPDMYLAATRDASAGKLKPGLTMYGYEAAGGPGAELMFAKDTPYGKGVPKDVVAELEAIKKKFASGALKLDVKKEDARGGV